MAANPADWPRGGRGDAGGDGRDAASTTGHPAAVAALRPDLTFENRFALALALQSIVQLRELPTSVGSEVWQRLGSILVVALLYLAQALTPALYIRRRDAIVSALKFCFFCFPLLRRPRGHVQRVLDWPATPGLRGGGPAARHMRWV